MASPDFSELLPDQGLPNEATNPHTAEDVAAILREHSWIAESHMESPQDVALTAWRRRAADLLGPHASDGGVLADLLSLVFHYDARALLQKPQSQAVLLRKGSREVIRALANLVLDGGDIDSSHFQEIVEGVKAAVPYRSRSLFQPVRLALAGRAGEGELDRVILLLDDAASLPFTPPVKGTRRRMIEFCAALD